MKKIIVLISLFLCSFLFVKSQDNVLSFDGVNDYVNMGNTLGNFGTSDFTVECWFRTSSSGVNVLLSKRSVCAHTNFWNLYISNGILTFEVDENTSGTNYGSLVSPLTYNNGQWHHVACTRSGTSIKMFIDGDLKVSNTTAGVTNLNNATEMYIGKTSCAWYNGLIDEVKIWNVARTSTQISNEFSIPTTLPQTGLISYLNFNVGTAGGNNTTITTINNLISPNPAYTLNGFSMTGAASNFIASSRTSITSVGTGLGSSFTNPGTNLIIQGNNLTGATAPQTKVGGTPVYEIVSNTGSILAVKSYSPSTGKVTVSTPTGGIASSITDFTYLNIPIQNALHFDGVNDLVNMPSFAGSFYTNDFTIEAWFKTTSNGANMPIISKRASCGASNFWNLTMVNGNLVWEQYQNGAGVNSFTITSPQAYNNGAWHHVAVRRYGVWAEMFVDGVYIGANSSAGVTNLNDSITNVQIGHSACGYFNGTIDEVRIWNVSRTPAQINAYYKVPLTLPQSDLRTYVTFNQGIPFGNNTGLTSISDPSNGSIYTLSNFALNGTISNYTPNTIVPIPFINSVSNTAICDGTPLIISGTNLTGLTAEQITVGGTPITSIVNSGSPLTVMPVVGSSGPVLISTLSGSSLSPETVTVYPNPIMTLNTAPSTICNGQSVTLNATTDIPCSIQWNPGNLSSSSITVSPNTTTVYTVTATSNSSSCSVTATKTINVNPSPIINSTNASPSNICLGGTTTLNVSENCTPITNFTGAFDVSNWTTANTPGSNGSVSITNAPTSINIIYPDNTSVGSATTFSIVVPETGVVSFNWQHTTANSFSLPLIYPNITLNNNPASIFNGFNQFGIGNQSGTQTINVTAGDELKLIAYNAFGDPSGGAITNISNIHFTPNCTNISTIWNPGAMNGITQTVSPSVSTTYTVTVTNSSNCSVSATKLVTVNPVPVISSALATPSTICAGGSSALSVNPPCTTGTISNFTGPFSLNHWTLNSAGLGGGSIDTNASPNAITFYYPIFTSTLTYDVTIPETGIISFNWAHVGGNLNTCTPGYKVNTNLGMLLFGFDQNNFGFQSGTQTINVNAGDTFRFLIDNYGGANMNNSVTTISNFQFTTNCTNTISWNPGAINSLTPTVSPTSTTTYTATVTNAYGCTVSSNVTVNVNSIPVAIASASATSLCEGSYVNLTCLSNSTQLSNLSGGITILDNTAANPYPSTVTINSLSPSGSVLKKVYINGLTHTFPDDIDIWLQSPGGQIVMLMSDAGGSIPLTNKNIIFADSVTNSLPNSSIINGNFYKPTNFDVNGANEPINPSLLLSSFTGNLNGTWSLYVRDDAGTDVGSISSFQLEFTTQPILCNWTANPSTSQSNITNPQALSTTALVNQATTYIATVTDANGCSNTSSVSINSNPIPIINSLSASPAAICAGGNSTLSLAIPVLNTCPPILNFTGPFAINNWSTTNSPGSNGSLNTTNSPNSVALIYPNSNGVSSTTSYSITIPSSGVFMFDWHHSTLTSYDMSIIYPNISINNNAASVFNGFNQYGSGNQTGTQTINVNAGDVVNLIAFNAYGVFSGNAITTISNLKFTPSTCYDVISWNSSSLNGANPMVTPLTTTTYTATVTGSNGCTTTATQTVTVNQIPTVTASASVTSLCPSTTNALHFDGVDDYITQPHVINSQRGTWEAWIQKENWNDGHSDNLFGNGNTFTSPNSFYVSLHPIVGFHFRYGGFPDAGQTYISNTTTFSFTPNSWHHLAITWNRDSLQSLTTIKLYIDGVAAGSTSTPLFLNLSDSTFIGGSLNDPTFGPGMMEEVRLWNIARTENEIAESMYRGTVYPQSGLYSLFNFDQGIAGGNNASINTLTDPISTSTISTLHNFSLNGNTSNFISSSRTLLPTITLQGNGATNYTWSNGIANGQPFIPAATTTYTVTGSDAIGCSATSTIEVQTCSVDLNVKAIIQGYYLGGGMMNSTLSNEGLSNPTNDVDSILVELHSSNLPNEISYSTTGILQTNGTLHCNFPSMAYGNEYYIVLKHRNSIHTWSANPVLISTNTNYDFTTDANKAYGDNMFEVETGIFALYSGDINQDENIDLLDISLLEADINNFEYGYMTTDINGDGNVDLLDSPIVENNVNGFIFSLHP